MTLEESIRKRIDELLKLDENVDSFIGEIYSATLSLAVQLYGTSSPQVDAVKQLKVDIEKSGLAQQSKHYWLVLQCKGVLKSYASDIDDGRLSSLRLEYQGQIFADFLNAAKVAMNNGAKDAAAVLACAALEDMLKRFAEINGLDVEDKDLTEVINSLKSAGVLAQPQSALLKGMVPMRNKALHAEWDKVDETGVRSVITFVEEFLIKNFS